MFSWGGWTPLKPKRQLSYWRWGTGAGELPLISIFIGLRNFVILDACPRYRTWPEDRFWNPNFITSSLNQSTALWFSDSQSSVDPWEKLNRSIAGAISRESIAAFLQACLLFPRIFLSVSRKVACCVRFTQPWLWPCGRYLAFWRHSRTSRVTERRESVEFARYRWTVSTESMEGESLESFSFVQPRCVLQVLMRKTALGRNSIIWSCSGSGSKE